MAQGRRAGLHFQVLPHARRAWLRRSLIGPPGSACSVVLEGRVEAAVGKQSPKPLVCRAFCTESRQATNIVRGRMACATGQRVGPATGRLQVQSEAFLHRFASTLTAEIRPAFVHIGRLASCGQVSWTFVVRTAHGETAIDAHKGVPCELPPDVRKGDSVFHSESHGCISTLWMVPFRAAFERHGLSPQALSCNMVAEMKTMCVA